MILKVMNRIIKFIREFIAIICITLFTGMLFMILLFAITLAFDKNDPSIYLSHSSMHH